MPKYAAINIPDPFVHMERTNRLRDVALDRQQRDKQIASQDANAQEDAQIRHVLSRANSPEQFEQVYPELHRINPMKAMELRKMYQASMKPAGEPFTLNPGDTRFGPDGKPLASVPAPPKSKTIEEEYYDPATTPERRAEIEKQRAAWATSGRAPETPAGFTLNPGDTRYDATGKVVASRPPSPPASDHGATIAQKAHAERWKQEQLQQLEAQYRNSQAAEFDPTTGQPIPRLDPRTNQPMAPMTVEQLDAAKREIQKSYLSQLGLPTNTLGGVARDPAPVAPPPPPAAPPPPMPTRAQGPGPAAQPPVAGPVRVITNGPDGKPKTFVFPNQAAADQFKRAAGIR